MMICYTKAFVNGKYVYCLQCSSWCRYREAELMELLALHSSYHQSCELEGSKFSLWVIFISIGFPL